jgi:hypothetical protein
VKVLFALQPQSVGSFLDDQSITLPRFQRRSAWTPEQRFRLALSLFKGYPMGTIVVKLETADEKGVTKATNYLLDGRQRRETLMGMRDPETIYAWARSTLKLKPSDTRDDVISKFQNYVTEYFFGQEDWEEPEEEDPILGIDPQPINEQGKSELYELEEDGNEQEGVDDTLEEAPEETQNFGEGLDDLLKLVLLVHPLTKGGLESSFRTPFNFDKSVKGLDFIKQNDKGKRYVSSPLLLSWLKWKSEVNLGGSGLPDLEQFLEWLTAGKQVDKPELVRKRLDAEWPNIERALLLLESLRVQLNSGVLGYLKINDGATPNDDKKIFEIINTAGTKLSAAEILSAKPSWDALVVDPPKPVERDVKNLYAEMGISFDGSVRRWDVAATLLDRLDYPIVFGDPESWQWQGIRAKRLEQKITLGFKVLSGYYQGKLMKDQVAALPSTTNVEWDTVNLETRIEDVSKALGDHWFFEALQGWKFSFMGDLSDAVGLDFLLLTILDWERKQEPKAAGSAKSSFRKNAIILFDRLVYEYVTEAWRGSSDNRIARNVEALKQSEESIFEAVSPAAWEKLLADVVDRGVIEGRSYLKRPDSRIRLLLSYAMVIAQVWPDKPTESIELDHIIPQQLFKQTGDKSLGQYLHHISNLELLPEQVNNSRSGRRLRELVPPDFNPTVKKAVSRYSLIAEDSFEKFSSVADISLLHARRGEVLSTLLLDERLKLLADPDPYQPPEIQVDTRDRSALSIAEIIAEGEGMHAEFKRSARWSHINGEKEKESELEVVRSLAGFMNARGGTLLIGIDDSGKVAGLNGDYKNIQKRPNRDGFQTWLTTDVLRPRLGPVAYRYLSISFEVFPQGEVCRIDARSSPEPVYVDQKRFFVRAHSTTQELSMADAVDWIAKHKG